MNLSKVVMSLCLLFLGAGLLSAQAYNGAGDKKLQIGFIPWGLGSGNGVIGTFDYGISNMVSLGVGADFYTGSDRRESNNNLFIFGRANLHLGRALNMPASMDLYPGVGVGFYNDGVGIGGHLGFRYFFTNNIGAFIEAGNRGSIGLSFNF
ncbi:MAG: hypothetical protein Q4F57_03160 [Weeksellaceae bacterium]|nr:hypothetical protein [Weeksellaceae bacterium]